MQGEPDYDDSEPIPRRSRNYAPPSPWWRPRSTFGRVLLGATAVLMIAALVAGGIITRRFATRDPHFRIPGASSIASTGLSEVNRADVLPVFGEDIGRNIFFVPLEERRKQLETIPWVKQASVMRFLPDRLSVSIVERTPVAFVRQGETVELADADGVILSMPPTMLAQHHYSFPVVTGINPKDTPAARRARMAVYQRFIAELDQNNQHLSEQVSEIDVSDQEDLRAWMPEQGADILAHFGEDHFLDRLALYKAHIAEWRQRYPKLIGVDLRYNREVPLEMAQDTPVQATKPTSNPKAVTVKAAAATPAKPAAQKTVVAGAQTSPIKPAASKPAVATPASSAKEIAAVPEAKTPKASAASSKPSTAEIAAAHRAALQRAAEAKKKAARLKTAKAKAAHERAVHKTQANATPAGTASTGRHP